MKKFYNPGLKNINNEEDDNVETDEKPLLKKNDSNSENNVDTRPKFFNPKKTKNILPEEEIETEVFILLIS
jgi:hypothetical protein